MWKQRARGQFVFLTLLAAYGGMLLIVGIARRCRPVPTRTAGSSRNCCRRVIVTGTFYHEGWFRSHILPLSQAAGEIIVVCDEPRMPVQNVRYCCPPRWARHLFGRALSKAIWMVVVGIRYPADVFVGYHIFPAAISALLAASLCGRVSCYQSTGGPIEVLGGGVNAENRLMSSLPGPSAYLESLALRVTRQFDCVVVRGQKAKRFFTERGPGGIVAVIPGSVDCRHVEWQDQREYDLVFVGRLSEIKQPLRFVEITAAVRRSLPSIRAAIVGDGPLMTQTRERAVRLGVADCIDFLGRRNDVARILARSKTFVLPSRSEGLSIALAEAMVAGAVPVVADVGELADLVDHGVNGFLVNPARVDEYADRIVSLLSDPDGWLHCARPAREAACKYNSVDAVAARWSQCLREVIELRAKPIAKVL